MDDNPYRAPLSDEPVAIGVLSGRQEDVRSVALYQRGVMVCILLYLLAIGAQTFAPERYGLLLAIGGVSIGLAGAVFVFLLAIKVYGVGVGVVLGLLTLVPCLGLFVLLVVNGKATTVMRENGYTVGLLGGRLQK